MTAEQENALAAKHGFTAKLDRNRGGNWCSFERGRISILDLFAWMGKGESD